MSGQRHSTAAPRSSPASSAYPGPLCGRAGKDAREEEEGRGEGRQEKKGKQKEQEKEKRQCQPEAEGEDEGMDKAG